MADITKSLRTYLLTQSTVTDVCGTRINFDEADQSWIDNSATHVLLHFITGDSVRSLDGPSGLARTVVQVDCLSDSHQTATDLREQIRLVTENTTNATWGSQAIGRCYANKIADSTDRPSKGAAHSRRKCPLELTVWHTEALPTT